MLFFERSGLFVSREAEYIHSVFNCTSNDHELSIRKLLKDPMLDIQDGETLPELLKQHTHILEVASRIGEPLRDGDITNLIKLTRQKGYDQNARYFNCACCGMGHYDCKAEPFFEWHIPGIYNEKTFPKYLQDLLLSDAEIAEYEGRGEFKCIYNVLEHPGADNLFYYLIPNLCEIDQTTGVVKAKFCNGCANSLWEKGQAPKLSVKYCDLLNFSRYPGMRQLTPLEMLILSPIKLYGLKYLICESGVTFNFSGNCMAVPHDAPEMFCKVW